MILVDTSIWIDHLRDSDPALKALLEKNEVLCHPFVIGEIALGSLRERALILSLLKALPTVVTADHDEVMGFMSKESLFGTGIGYVDVHLLASVKLEPSTRLWTRDKRLAEAAEKLSVAYNWHC